MKHIGDITKINGKLIDPVDVITGGSPCQDLSVAGLRAGLAGERSGLFMEQIRIIKEMREATNGKQPRFMVWENVPGAFSSNKGEDFRAVLEETARICDQNAVIPRLEGKQKWTPAGCIMGDGWSIAWRVHDAQFWGVPQRRKRISLVADFAGGGAPEILFEREGMPGDTEESGKERKRTACDAEESADVASWGFEPGAARRLDTENCFNEELSPTPRSEMGDNQIAVVYGISSFDSKGMKSSNPHSGIYEAETSRTLDLNGGNPACNQGGIAVVFDASRRHNYEPFDDVCETVQAHYGTGGGNVPIVLEGNGSRPSHRGDGYVESETMYTLNSTEHHAVCIGNGQINDAMNPDYEVSKTLNCLDDPMKIVVEEPTMIEMTSTKNTIVEDGISPTLTARMGTGGNQVNAVCMDVGFFTSHEEQAGTLLARQYKDPPVVMYGSLVIQNPIVRRLTPMECERLQDFPDGWTDIGDWVDSKGKKHKGDADSPRYKALGNSIALPFWKWMAERMVGMFDNSDHITMGSLFDGIGGFPLVFSECGVEPVWASEIEEFCIAVTNKRFNEV